MKGFIKILESIIASVIILSTIAFFFSFRGPAETQQVQFSSVLAVLQKNGSLNSSVTSNNVGALNTTLRDVLPKTVDFSVEIIGIPNPIIKIACVCSDAEKDDLAARLGNLDFAYRSRRITILIDKGNFNDMANSNADILYFPSYRLFSPDEKNLLIKFLQNRTLFMLADLDQPQVQDGVMDDLFGLAWGTSASSNGKFVDTENPGNLSYRISRHYSSLGGDKNDLFTPEIPPLLTKNKIISDWRTVIDSPGVSIASLVKVNLAGSRGRTVWFVNYALTLPFGPNTEMNRLFKAAILWASGERYNMDPQFKIIPAGQFYRQYSYIDVLDGFETFMISLKIWNVFF